MKYFHTHLNYLPHIVNIVHLQYMLHLTYTTECRSVKEMINLYINERRAGDVTILDLKGKLRIGGSTLALYQSVRCLLREEKSMILLNLAGVTFFDSCGLGELVASQVAAQNKGGKIKLVGLTAELRELLTATRLLTVFDHYENEADALQEFADNFSKVEKTQLAFV